MQTFEDFLNIFVVDKSSKGEYKEVFPQFMYYILKNGKVTEQQDKPADDKGIIYEQVCVNTAEVEESRRQLKSIELEGRVAYESYVATCENNKVEYFTNLYTNLNKSDYGNIREFLSVNSDKFNELRDIYYVPEEDQAEWFVDFIGNFLDKYKESN